MPPRLGARTPGVRVRRRTGRVKGLHRLFEKPEHRPFVGDVGSHHNRATTLRLDDLPGPLGLSASSR